MVGEAQTHPVELFGLVTDFRSANLYHVRDSELDSERIMLELFPDAKKGQRRLTLCDGTRWPAKKIGTYVSYAQGEPWMAAIPSSPIFSASSVE